VKLHILQEQNHGITAQQKAILITS
jgi:hypothetical protein